MGFLAMGAGGGLALGALCAGLAMGALLMGRSSKSGNYPHPYPNAHSKKPDESSSGACGNRIPCTNIIVER
jgi:hypothetical protein